MSAAATIDAYCTVGVDREYDLTESNLVSAMDAAGVDRAVIAPPDRYLAVHNRDGNEAIRKAADSYPARLVPSCSANPWYGDRAVSELERAIGEGARMVVFHPFVQGFSANDELLFPALEVAAREQVPVYVHTGPPGNASPWQIVDLAERFPRSTSSWATPAQPTSGMTSYARRVRRGTSHRLVAGATLNFAAHVNRLGKERGLMDRGPR